MVERLREEQVTPLAATAERLILDLVRGRHAIVQAPQRSQTQVRDEELRKVQGTIETILPFFPDKGKDFAEDLSTAGIFLLVETNILKKALAAWSVPPEQRGSEMKNAIIFVQGVGVEDAVLNTLVQGWPLYQRSLSLAEQTS